MNCYRADRVARRSAVAAVVAVAVEAIVGKAVWLTQSTMITVNHRLGMRPFTKRKTSSFPAL